MLSTGLSNAHGELVEPYEMNFHSTHTPFKGGSVHMSGYLTKCKYGCVVVAGLLAAGVLVRAHAGEKPEVKKVDIIGYAAYDFRQIVKGNWDLSAIDHYWSHEVFAGIGFDAEVSEQLRLVARVEGKMWDPYPSSNTRAFRTRNYSLWLDQACATYSMGNPENSAFSITGGYFVYKYNPEVRNLGEFMFRSWTYPGIIMNDFDFPAARILGFRFHCNLLEGMVKNDFIVQDESEQWPFGDISLSDIATVKIGDVAEIGGGVDFAHLFSVSKYTTYNDPMTNQIVDYIDSTGARVYGEGFYTFKAIKLMGRASIDPKSLMGNPGLFGKSDLKIYGEIGVIGTKDQSFYYTDISKRMPIMFGLNLPTFKVLDVVALEFEHYAYPFTPSNQNAIMKAAPLPENEGVAWRPEDWKSDDWKWSVYLKKTLIPGIIFTLQLSRDHYRLPYSDGMPGYTESLVYPGEWSWIAKFTGSL
jgi:hypothetical protein